MKGVTAVDFYLLQREAVSIESINGQNGGTLVRALCHPTRASCDYLSSCRSSELINALNCQASRLQAQASPHYPHHLQLYQSFIEDVLSLKLLCMMKLLSG